MLECIPAIKITIKYPYLKIIKGREKSSLSAINSCLCTTSYIFNLSLPLSSSHTSNTCRTAMSTLNHLFDLPEQICYVECGFCATILMVITSPES